MSPILLPFNRGRAATEAHVREVLRPLADAIRRERERFNFSPGARGWCYVLEGLGLCSKGDFAKVQERITRCRKLGLLPLNICAVDDTRESQGGGAWAYDLTPAEFLARAINGLRTRYRACNTLDVYRFNVEVLVEKLDLVGLFQRVLYEFGVPVICTRGSNDMHSRAGILQRAASTALPTVVLAFGDHDPGGLSIISHTRDNLAECVVAAEVDASVIDRVSVVRAGLLRKDVEALGLTWIDGLETSAGGDLASPSHPQHRNADVQAYLAEFGPRKCEANALIARPTEAAEVLRRELLKYISASEVAEVRRRNGEANKIVAGLVVRAVEFVESLEEGDAP